MENWFSSDWTVTLTPVDPCPRPLRPPQGSGHTTAVVQLNRSLAETFSSLQQLQQQHWLDHR